MFALQTKPIERGASPLLLTPRRLVRACGALVHCVLYQYLKTLCSRAALHQLFTTARGGQGNDATADAAVFEDFSRFSPLFHLFTFAAPRPRALPGCRSRPASSSQARPFARCPGQWLASWSPTRPASAAWMPRPRRPTLAPSSCAPVPPEPKEVKWFLTR